jgi:cytoskeletal protein CcmA (bactofilin family)
MQTLSGKLSKYKNIGFVNEIGAGSSVVGNLECDGNFKVAGGLLGNIFELTAGNSTLVIAEGAYIQGNIQYSNLIVMGSIEGSIDISDRMVVYPSAIIRGDINYKQLNIHPDAKVNGRITCANLITQEQTSTEIIAFQAVSKTGSY